MAYLFSCPIMRLCKATNIPEVAGIDNKFPTKKIHNLIRYNKNQLRLTLDRGAGVATDPPVTDTSLAPNIAV